MQVDKTTLTDLSIFHRDEEQSVFHHLNFTHTNGGRAYFMHLLGTPLNSIASIQDTQNSIKILQGLQSKWPLTQVTNGSIMVLEKYYETPMEEYPKQPSFFNSLFYKFIHAPDYSITKYTVEHTIEFLKGMDRIVQLFSQIKLSKQLQIWYQSMEHLLNKASIKEMMQVANGSELTPKTILEYGIFLRNHFKRSSNELIETFFKLDAYMSMAIACEKFQFAFPVLVASDQPFVEAKGLYHLLLPTPVAYDTELDISRNFIFLTGANMGGKSTFIKAVGLSVYLAHLGMGVPAKTMRLSLFHGLLSNIQVEDNLFKGESYFFNEVQRIKKTLEKISDGNNWLILIDELFKGTNIQDAMKCSTAVIEGLRKMQKSLFILSTHLYEIGDGLKQYPNIQFRYFETSMENDQLEFSYQLKEGISNDRIGYLILKREGVTDILDKL